MSKQDISFPKNVSGKLFLFAIIIAVALAFYNISVSEGYVALTAPIVASSPLITVILGMFFIKEKVGSGQIFGIALILAGIALIAI